MDIEAINTSKIIIEARKKIRERAKQALARTILNPQSPRIRQRTKSRNREENLKEFLMPSLSVSPCFFSELWKTLTKLRLTNY